jgi:protein involved in polysaccharide export with SLBB domain
MQNFLKIGFFFIVLFTFLWMPNEVNAQIPSNLSNIKSSQITDAQLMQFLQQAQSTGMTEEQLLQEFKKRGLPDAEIEVLVNRIKSMTGVSLDMGGEKDDMSDPKNAKTNTRKYKGETRPFRMPANPSRVFGADLFSSADPIFVPNLKIATPRNYVLGADDELQLDIYGNNISNQKMTVSPDGFINVRYAGPINVSGMTIEQAAGVIKARLSKFYPALSTGATKVQLSLGSVRSIQVTVIGAVNRPGSITLPSIATLFNALYASGGPLDNGSFRNIELLRDNKVIAQADLYDFILKGDQHANVSLRDNDVIRVPYAKAQVAIEGGVNRVGIFEIKQNETVQQLLDYAGGFRGNAFKGRITGARFTDVEKSVIDLPKENFNSFSLMHGDSLFVGSVLEKYDNRVFITGAVFKPGAYSLENGMDLYALIKKAQGLKQDAFKPFANFVRLKEDYSKEYLSVDLREVISGKLKIQLKREDSIHVESILELKEKSEVIIAGPVRTPGKYVYDDSLTLKGLILKAGGLLENASALKIEIGRRKKDISFDQKGASTSDIIVVDLDQELNSNVANQVLQPYDVVNIKKDPSKIKQVTVDVKGEILLVGSYTLQNPEEKLSSIINRAGGLLPYANINGAKLIRKKSIEDSAFIRRLALTNLSTKSTEKQQSDSVQLIELDQLNSSTTEVALDLDKILANPGGQDDMSLQDGDEIIIPRFVNTVSVSGEVLKPVTVQFETGKTFDYYISAAGGFNKSAYKKRVFVVYPNGRSSRTKNFLGMKKYPKVAPGSSIFVPVEPARQTGFDPAKAAVLVSAFASVMTTLVLLFR